MNQVEVPYFELRVLGPIELIDTRTGEQIAIQSAKMRALLACLSAAPGYRRSRRNVAALLWSQSGEEQARQSLRQLLSSFRRLSPAAEAVAFDDPEVKIDTAIVSVDRASLMDWRADAPLSSTLQAAEAYRGRFATGAELGEPAFDDWLAAEQSRTDQVAISLFDHLVRALSEVGQNKKALEIANRLLEIDPLREESQRAVISQEALVSGRASAMQRYETFRLLLREELGVRPEAATLALIEQLRQAKSAVPQAKDSPDRVVAPASAPAGWRRPYIAAAILAALAVGVPAAYQVWSNANHPIAYVGEEPGRVSVVILPFETSSGRHPSKSWAANLHAETLLAFARNTRLSIVSPRKDIASDDLASVGRSHRARYVVKTRLIETPNGSTADVNLIDSSTGVSVWAGPVAVTASDSTSIRFARQFYRYISSEITLHRARVLSDTDANSIPALLWRAEAARLRTRVGVEDPSEVELFEEVLKRDPNQLFALLGLSDHYILKVAREQSQSRAKDVERAESLLLRAREQAPNLAEVSFSLGMINKLQGKFAQAGIEFERTVELDRTHWNAAAQAAHIKLFLGRFEEAYSQMESVTAQLLPDIASAETAYIAGETALMTGHPDRAITYLDLAISGNPVIARIHAMHAAALRLAGRTEQASVAAAKSKSLSPAYTPEMMARRGGANASQRYRAARDEYVAAFRSALVAGNTN